MGKIKIHFELEVDENGYPPISIESLNGDLISSGVAKIDNAPFFVEGISLGDVVNIVKIDSDNNKDYQFVSVEKNSENISLSVLFFNKEIGDMVLNYFSLRNIYSEYGHFSGFSMLAISIPENEYSDEVVIFLDRLEKQEKISYAELCI